MYIGLFKTNLILLNKFCHSCLDKTKLFVRWNHIYQKSLNRLLNVCYVPTTSAVLIAFFSSFFAATINSTNEANKEAGMHHYAVYLFRCLWMKHPHIKQPCLSMHSILNCYFFNINGQILKKNDESKSQNRLFED